VASSYCIVYSVVMDIWYRVKDLSRLQGRLVEPWGAGNDLVQGVAIRHPTVLADPGEG